MIDARTALKTIAALAICLTACASYAGVRQAAASNLDDLLGVKMGQGKLRIGSQATLDYYVNDFYSETRSATAFTHYDYHYEYPVWQINSFGYYGISDCLELSATNLQTIPYRYGYNSDVYDSSLRSDRYLRHDFVYDYQLDGSTTVALTGRSKDRGMQAIVSAAIEDSYATVDYVSDNTRSATSYRYLRKVSEDLFRLGASFRCLTAPSVKMREIRSDLDGRYFALPSDGQYELALPFTYVNRLRGFDRNNLNVEYYVATSNDYYLQTTTTTNQRAGYFTLSPYFRYGITDDIELLITTYYLPVYAVNYDYDYYYPNNTMLRRHIIHDFEYPFYGYIWPRLRVRTSDSTEVVGRIYVLGNRNVAKEDDITTRSGVITTYESNRTDTTSFDTNCDITWRYMSRPKDGKSVPYNGTNLDSILRPLLDKGQISVELVSKAYFYYQKQVVHSIQTSPQDYRISYSYVRFQPECTLGYGVTDSLELLGSFGIRFQNNFGHEQIAFRTTIQNKHRYPTQPYGSVKLTYRPSERLNFFVQAGYSVPTSDYLNRVTSNYQTAIYSKYEYNNYDLQFGGQILF